MDAAYFLLPRPSPLTRSRRSSIVETMQDGMIKDGAVRCSLCGSPEVESKSDGPVETEKGHAAELYRCTKCGKTFSKAV